MSTFGERGPGKNHNPECAGRGSSFRCLQALRLICSPVSLILECQFPDTSKKYPVLPRREFGRKRLTYISENEAPARFGGRIRENSLYFPRYQGIRLQRRVRRSLSAQPPSRGFSDSLPRRSECSARSPELRHQLVVFRSDLRLESAPERKNAASFPVYLYWPFSGVTLGKQQMLPQSGRIMMCHRRSNPPAAPPRALLIRSEPSPHGRRKQRQGR